MYEAPSSRPVPNAVDAPQTIQPCLRSFAPPNPLQTLAQIYPKYLGHASPISPFSDIAADNTANAVGVSSERYLNDIRGSAVYRYL